MAKSEKALTEALRTEFLAKIIALFEGEDSEVLRVKSGQIAIPCVDEERNDRFVTIKVEIPKGSREDGEGYDGYGLAQQYAEHCAEQAEKAKKAEADKQKKIAADKAKREAMAKAKAEHQANKANA